MTAQKSAVAKSAVAGVSLSSIILSTWVPLITLIFGGCCSNVFTFEKLLSQVPNTTHLITFIQFAIISLEGFIANLDIQKSSISRLYLRQNRVPLRRWLIHVAIFFTTSVLNNYALSLNISIPVHVIFRSSGTIFTMIIGMAFMKKKYNACQIASGALLTVGLILTTIGNSMNSSSTVALAGNVSLKAQTINNLNIYQIWPAIKQNVNLGILCLLMASIMISVNGFLMESTFNTFYPDRSLANSHAKEESWKESLFYQHFLALPFFLVFKSQIATELQVVLNSNSTGSGNSSSSLGPSAENIFGSTIDHPFIGTLVLIIFENSAIFYLVLNVLTQYVCVRGVNQLSATTNLLTVSVVLLLRKFTSLLLSIALFKNSLNGYCWLGTGFIFLGAFLYSYGSNGSNNKKKEAPQGLSDQSDEKQKQ